MVAKNFIFFVQMSSPCLCWQTDAPSAWPMTQHQRRCCLSLRCADLTAGPIPPSACWSGRRAGGTGAYRWHQGIVITWDWQMTCFRWLQRGPVLIPARGSHLVNFLFTLRRSYSISKAVTRPQGTGECLTRGAASKTTSGKMIRTCYTDINITCDHNTPGVLTRPSSRGWRILRSAAGSGELRGSYM